MVYHDSDNVKRGAGIVFLVIFIILIIIIFSSIFGFGKILKWIGLFILGVFALIFLVWLIYWISNKIKTFFEKVGEYFS